MSLRNARCNDKNCALLLLLLLLYLTMKISVREVCVSADIRSGHLHNTRQKCYSLGRLLGHPSLKFSYTVPDTET